MEYPLIFLLPIVAGIINGSFALSIKYIKNWQFENIWLQFVFWAFLILPWAFMFFLTDSILSVYQQAPTNVIIIMVIFGFIFGIGQMAFAMALNSIGLGLGFVINIGLGTALGSLIPLVIQHPAEIPTLPGMLTIIAVLLIIFGLILYYFAGSLRDKQQNSSQHVKAGQFKLGLIFAIIAGISSAGQNFAFSMSAGMQEIALAHGMQSFAAANIVWPGFLTLAAIPYALYMLFLLKRNRTYTNYYKSGFDKNYLLVFIMGLCWYGSLILYGKASQLIGELGPVIGWPFFMVLIILTSNFWGWRHKEWANCQPKIIKILITGLIALIVAVILLSVSAYLSR